MEIISEAAMAAMRMPRFEDGCINLQELIRQLAESVVNEIMDAEADQMCAAQKNTRNGYRERKLKQAKKQNDACILVTGLFFLIIGIILTVVWYLKFYNV